jgi:SAM-dependent methyltransferase
VSDDDAARFAQAADVYGATGDDVAWFEQLYATSRHSGIGVPWDRGGPHPLLLDWAQGRDGAGRRALVVGEGLGADAELLAARGFAVTAFDIARTAIDGARERFPDTQVDYRVANLLNPPPEWREAFDLVVESLTVQSLPRDVRAAATANVSGFVAPGGTLLVIATAEDPEHPTGQGPPWPLTRDEVDAFGLEPVSVEQVEGRWRAELRR